MRLFNWRADMTDDKEIQNSEDIFTDEEGMLSRRNFLDGLSKWSKIVIGVAVLGGSIITADRKAHAGAGWVNRGIGGGAAWANRGGGAWANRGAAWANRGGSWVNRY